MTLYKWADAHSASAVGEIMCEDIEVCHEIDVTAAQIDLILS